MGKKTILAVAATVITLVFAVNIFVYILAYQKSTLEQSLASILPDVIEGWRTHDMPMAESEEMQARVQGILLYDDAVFRIFEKDGTQISVYVAYWSPGKAPYHRVAVHTPDTCWVHSGWDRLDRTHALERTVDGQPLLPMECGVFERNGNIQHVAFWHIVGNAVYNYAQTGWDTDWRSRLSRALLFVNDIESHGLNLRQEQFFVRISSNRPIDDIWGEPAFQEILRSLSVIGLTRDDPESSAHSVES